jgi:hypothetical protein
VPRSVITRMKGRIAMVVMMVERVWR